MNKYSQQKFSMDVIYILRILELIDEGKVCDKKEISLNFGIGEPKAEAYLDYLDILNLIDKTNKITFLGKVILKLNGNVDYSYSILHYQFAKGWNKGGHEFYSLLVNNFLYEKFSDFDNTFNKSYFLKKINKLNAKGMKTFNDLMSNSLKALVDAETGFGKMGIVEKSGEDEYRVHSYYLEPLVALYIICDMWDSNQTAMSIDEMISDDYNLGKMFLMDESTISEILEELQVKRYIVIEKSNTLNQIKLMDGVNKEFVLEEIIKDA